jgi:hypothetical protein
MTPTLLDRAPAVFHNSVEQGLLMASSKSERKQKAAEASAVSVSPSDELQASLRHLQTAAQRSKLAKLETPCFPA